MTQMSKKRFFLIYLILFTLLSLLIFAPYTLNGQTNVRGDGWAQHIQALAYYGSYIRDAIRTHSLPQWDFSLGEGGDILSILNYYGIGNPFALVFAFFPAKDVLIPYALFVRLQLFAAGIAFAILCRACCFPWDIRVLTGSLAYAFCGWGLLTASGHTIMIIPLVTFPLLITGIEHLIRKGNGVPLCAAVFFAGISQFYFFYMQVVLTGIYALIRIFLLKEESRKKWKLLGRVLLWAVFGVLSAGVILCPVLYSYAADSRMEAGSRFLWLYPKGYYERLPKTFLTIEENEYACCGIILPAILAGFLLLKDKKHTLLKICGGICLLFTLLPLFGRILNGFAYAVNRWSWAFQLFWVMTLIFEWEQLAQISRKDGGFLLICLIAYTILCAALPLSRTKEAFICLGFGSLILFLCFRKGSALLLSVLTLLCVMNNGFWFYSESGAKIAKASVSVERFQKENWSNEAGIIADFQKREPDEDFFRYSVFNKASNASMERGYSSLNSYWSLMGSGVNRFNQMMELPDLISSYHSGMFGQTILETLSGVRYYIRSDSDPEIIPFGYRDISNEDTLAEGKHIYRNETFLPLGYTYTNTLSESLWNELGTGEKQEALLNAVILTNGDETLPHFDTIHPAFQTEPNGADISGPDIQVSEPNTGMILNFEGIPNSELSVTFKGIRYTDIGNAHEEKLPISLKASDGIERSFKYLTPSYQRYMGRTGVSINMGFSEEKRTSVTLTFATPGTYHFDAIDISCLPMDHYEARISALKENVLENVEMRGDTIRGTLDLETSKVLLMTVPYSPGWKAFVDGNETISFPANIKYTGIPLTPGSHTVELRYERPFQKIGMLCSLAGFLFAGTGVLYRRKQGIIEKK